MMINEGLIPGVGAVLKDFFGVPKVRITGILERTGTPLDDIHIVSPETLATMKLGEDLVITRSPLGELSLYYLYDESNIPKQFKTVINPKNTEIVIDDAKFLPAYVGYDDAKEMFETKEITGLHDKLMDEDGSNLVVMGLPKKTFTMLDMMRFVPKAFAGNVGKKAPGQ